MAKSHCSSGRWSGQSLIPALEEHLCMKRLERGEIPMGFQRENGLMDFCSRMKSCDTPFLLRLSVNAFSSSKAMTSRFGGICLLAYVEILIPPHNNLLSCEEPPLAGFSFG
ncbi:hypothetical protein Tco_1461132 [Tanacetum coccineum]